MYICTVNARIFGDFSAKKIVYICTVNDRVFGDFSAKKSYIYAP
jgi:hypothetical protein